MYQHSIPQGNPQGGYDANPLRSAAHDELKFETYYGWKECRELGISYVPAPLHKSNIHVRVITSDATQPNGVAYRYQLDRGLTPVFDQTEKYAYPVGMSDADKRKFRAAARKAAKKVTQS